MTATTDPIAVTGVDFVAIPTRERAAAVDCYGRVLGLPRRGSWGSSPATEFQAG